MEKKGVNKEKSKRRMNDQKVKVICSSRGKKIKIQFGGLEDPPPKEKSKEFNCSTGSKEGTSTNQNIRNRPIRNPSKEMEQNKRNKNLF